MIRCSLKIAHLLNAQILIIELMMADQYISKQMEALYKIGLVFINQNAGEEEQQNVLSFQMQRNTCFFVNLTSITACNTLTMGGTSQLDVYKGSEIVTNLNVTKNKCHEFCTFSHDLDENLILNYKYIEVIDNKQDGTRAGLGFFIYSVSFYYMNFVRNSRPQSNWEGFIHSLGGLYLYNSCIYGNQGDGIFSSDNKWTIRLYSCYVDSATKISGSLSFNKRASEKFPIDSPTYGTNNCEVIYLSLNWKLITFDRKPQHNPFNQKTSVFTLFSRFLM